MIPRPQVKQEVVSSASVAVLVLGMANAGPEYVSWSKGHVGTTVSAKRDSFRLTELKKLHPEMDIVSMNDKQTAEECAPNKHFRGSFGPRSVGGLIDAYGTNGHLHLAYVFCDYFRFPQGYIEVAYEQLCDMLRALIAKGVIRAAPFNSEVIVPNYPELRVRLQAKFDSANARPITQPKWDEARKCNSDETERVYLKYEAIRDPRDYPLYDATERLWRRTPGAVRELAQKSHARQDQEIASVCGGFIHQNEIASLHRRVPFVRITITTDKRIARSYQAAFEATMMD